MHCFQTVIGHIFSLNLHCLYAFFLLNFIATVSVLLIHLGRTFTVGAISTGTFKTFTQTSFPPNGKSQICMKGFLRATSLSSIGY